MKKIIIISLMLISAKCYSQTENNFMQKNTFWDSVYFKVVPYNSGAGTVHLGLDTVASSPTFGKLVRKTAGGFTNLTSFVSQNNWKTFYSDGSGDVTELSIGSSGKVLTSNGTTSAPSWETPTTGVTTMAAIGATPNANGASISGSTLTLQPADASFGGVLTTGAQLIAGAKTFIGGITSSTSSSPAFLSSINTATTNANQSMVNVQRFTSGTAANGLAGSIDFYVENSSTTGVLSNQIISGWRDITHASRSGMYAVTGVSNTLVDTLYKAGDYVSLTESSATVFSSTSLATGKICGGQVVVTIEANDATDFQSRTLRFVWSAVNKAGTITVTISTPEEVVALSSGTLTCTITAVDAGSGVLDFKANAVSSLTQTTLRASYQTFKNF